MGKIAVAIFAAGRGSRFTGDCPKPLAIWQERSLLDHALTASLGSGLTPLILVVGYAHQQVAASAPPNINIVHNPHWQQGISSSLKAALHFLENDKSVEALCVGLADQPLIGAIAYQHLAAAYHNGAKLAVATYGGVRGNPVLLARSLWSEAMQLQGDEGARQLMRTHPVVEVACDSTGNPQDIDTLEDLVKLKNI
jgi:molybdenum cofactor cytidylyltransferase